MILARLGLQDAYRGGAPVNLEQANANAISGDPRTDFVYPTATLISGANSSTEEATAFGRYHGAGSPIRSTYEGLDLDTKPWMLEVGCPVNPEQKNTNELTPPDEAQRQSYIFKRLQSQPAGAAATPH
jgi:hypothetical protein